MNLARAYNIWACLCAALAITAFCSADGNAALGVFAAPVLMVGWWQSARGLRLPRWLVNALLAGAVGYAFVRALGRRVEVTDIATLVVFIQLIKLGDRRGPRDDVQVLSLAVFLAIAAMLTSNVLAVGVQLALFLPLLVGAVMLFQLHWGQAGLAAGLRERLEPPPREALRPVAGRGWLSQLRWTVALATCGALCVALGVFVLMPRGIGRNVLGEWEPPATGSYTGFSEQVRLGTRDVISESPRIALEVAVRMPEGPNIGAAGTIYYLRGAVLSEYREGMWVKAPTERVQELRLDADHRPFVVSRGASNPIEQVVTIRNAGEGRSHLFAMWRPVSIQLKQSGSLYISHLDKVLRRGGSGGRLEYTVASSLVDPVERQPTQRTPVDFPSERIASLAAGVLDAAGLEPDPDSREIGDDHAAANAIASHLRTGYGYTLSEQDVPAGVDPIEHFLFQTREGHCEYFASAMVAMCRSVGIHARVVTGYVAVEFNRGTGAYTVRESNAHAWVEAELGRDRWRRFDPSPPDELSRVHRPPQGLLARARQLMDTLQYAWNTSVVSFDEQKRRQIWSAGAGGGLLARLDGVAARLRVGRPESVAGAGVWLAAAAGSFIGAWHVVRLGMRALRRRWRIAVGAGRARGEIAFYERLLALLRAAGHEKPAWRPPVEHAGVLGRAEPALGAAVLSLSRLYYEARFGLRRLTEADLARAERLLDQIEAARTARGGPGR